MALVGDAMNPWFLLGFGLYVGCIKIARQACSKQVAFEPSD